MKGQKNPEWDYMGKGDFSKGVGLFEYDNVNSTDILKARRKDRLIIHVDKDMLVQDKYQFRTSKNKQVYHADIYGISPNYFGGRATKVAEMKDEPYVLVVNDDDITVGLLIRKDWLDKFTYPQLYDIARGQGLKVNKSLKKNEIIEMLTNL